MPANKNLSSNDQSPCYLALDQGSQSTRAMLFDQAGRCLASAQQKVSTRFPQPQYVEQSPDELLQSLRQVITDVYHQLDCPNRVVAAGLATQRSSIVCWNRTTGKTLSPVISWQDTRATDSLKQLQAFEKDIHQRTGLRLNAHAGASKIAWCLQNIPSVRNALKKGDLAIAPLASYLVYGLLEEHPFVIDPLNGVRSLLLNYKDKAWDEALLNRFAIPQSILPAVQACKSHFGDLRFGEKLIPLKLLIGDQTAALFAQGSLREETAYITLGSGGFITALVPEPAEKDGRLLYTLTDLARPSELLVEATVNGAANALRWLEEKTGCKATPDQLAQWLASIDSPPLFLNGVGGLAAPFWLESFESHFVDADTAETSEKFVAVLESILFLLRVNLDMMQKSGVTIKRLRVGGGLSRQDTLCQRLADLTNLEVHQSQEKEATAKGIAALLNDKPESWLVMKANKFMARDNAALQERYQRWLSLMPSF